MPVFLLLVGPEKLLLIFNTGTNTVIRVLLLVPPPPHEHFPMPAP